MLERTCQLAALPTLIASFAFNGEKKNVEEGNKRKDEEQKQSLS